MVENDSSRSDQLKQYVSEVLEILENEDELFSYTRVDNCEGIDVSGVHFILFFENDLALPLQVKNKENATGDFSEHYLHTKVLPVTESDDVKSIKEKILSILEKEFDRYTGTFSKSEQFVEDALREMQEDGEINYYIRADRHRQLDKAGIDFLIFFENMWVIPLQVKSRGGDNVKEDHFKKHPHAKALLVSRSDGSVQAAKKKLRKLIEWMRNTDRSEYVVKRVK